MKMMNRLGGLLLSLAVLVGCQRGDNDIPSTLPDNDSVEIPTIELTDQSHVCDIEHDGSQLVVEFVIDVAWELAITSYDNQPVEWVTADKNTGEAGEHSVTLRFDENSSMDNRLSRIEIRDISKSNASRAQNTELDTMVNSLQGVCFAVSILQSGYYSMEYPKGLAVTVTPD